ncbi:restriction endonuclease [Streptomyces sp. NPDC020480]|uniref:restriction endonuclease n=1 Tax=Streptomyces sp. NPDC020480 TaxID=3365076 RepID=UPI00379D1537
MINSTTATPSYPRFNDFLDIFLGPNGFDRDRPPTIDELFGERFSAAEQQRTNLETLKQNARRLDTLLDAASRRVFLTDRHETSIRFFEQLAAEEPAIRHIVGQAETALANGQGKDVDRLIDEANAWVHRLEKIREEAQIPHQAAVAKRFVALYELHHREFEHRIAQLLNFDGFTVERWNGGAGDLAADVIVRLPAGDRRAIVQCKHTSDPGTTIGSAVIQQVSGTRQAHDAELAFVVTALFSRSYGEVTSSSL